MASYVILDKDNIVVGASQLGEKVEKSNMIETEKYSPELIGKKYEKTTGTFVDSGIVPEVEVNKIDLVLQKLDEILAALKKP